MGAHTFDRRTVLKSVAAFAATGLASCASMAPGGGRSTGALPARGEFVIRGANVLTLDPKIPDLARGDVHVRDGAIVAVAPAIDASAATIDGRGMICMPGFVDTHWHLWTSALRPLMRVDVAEV